MEKVVCNLCGSDKYEVVYANLPDRLLQRREVTSTLVRCLCCGLIYQNPRPTLKEIGQHYPPEYEAYHYHSELNHQSTLSRWAAEYGIAKRRRYVTRYKRLGTLLDVGCGTGLFLKGMKQSGCWELWGIEPSMQAAEVARQLGFRVFTATLQEVDLPEQYFDVVTLWDVIEHLHDPASALRQIANVLKPDGILVIRTPNFESWEARLFGPYWSGLEPPRHLFVFTPRTLEAMLAKTGFRILHRDCRSGGYMVFVRSVQFRLADTALGAQQKDVLIKVLRHPLMRTLTAPLFTFSSLGLRGAQVVVVASRSLSLPA